jgi:succinoglycan biosynthesis transport protein ExoP
MELLPPPRPDGHAPARDDDTVDVLAVFGVLRRRKWFILTVGAAGALLGALLGLRVETVYTAQATVVAAPEEQPLSEDQAAQPEGYVDDPTAFTTQQQLIRSRGHVARVMEDLGLFEDPEFNPALRVSEDGGISVADALARVIAAVPKSWLVATGLADDVEPEETEESVTPDLARQRAVDQFQNKLEVASEVGTWVMTIDFTSVDPAKAAQIANRTADLYVQSQIDARSESIGETARWLRDQIKALREEVRTAEAAVERFKAENDLLDTEEVTLSEQELAEINRELIAARAELAAQQARLQEVEDLRGRGQLDAVAEVVASPVIIGLRGQETDLLRREAELAQEYGERHPVIQQLTREKANIATKVQQEISRTVRSLESEAQVARARVAALEQEITASKKTSAVDRETEVELRELEREAQAARSLYETLLQNLAETGARQDFVRPDVRVLSLAKMPESPSSPGLMLFAGAGFTVSLIFGGLIALLRERLDHGLRGARQARAALGLPVLALVPKLGRIKGYEKPHRYLAAKPMSVYCEAIRSVYTALRLREENAENHNVILITSALPGEGKTTFAVSLAAFAACVGHRTLLVDFDLRHQRVAEELGLPAVGWLDDSRPRARGLGEMVQRDPETGVDVLLITGHPTEPTSFFDRPEKIADLLADLGRQYELVILDSAPAIVASETRVAALHADKVIYAVRWGETPDAVARDGLEALREAGANVVGAVITMVDLKKHAQYGYEDVAHYYGKYCDSSKYYRS